MDDGDDVGKSPHMANIAGSVYHDIDAGEFPCQCPVRVVAPVAAVAMRTHCSSSKCPRMCHVVARRVDDADMFYEDMEGNPSPMMKASLLYTLVKYRLSEIYEEPAQKHVRLKRDSKSGKPYFEEARPAPSPSPDFVPGLPHIMLIELR